MGRIGCARDERLGLQGFAPVAEQSRAQGLAAYPVTLSPQLDLQAARAVAAIVGVKNRHHFRFPSRRWLPHCPHRLLQTPGVVAAGDDPDHLAELLNWIVSTLLINKWQHAHEAGGWGKMAMFFLKCRVPAPIVYWPPLPALPRPQPDRRARAAGPLSARHKSAWRRYSGRGRRPAWSGFHWPAAGLRRERPHHRPRFKVWYRS